MSGIKKLITQPMQRKTQDKQDLLSQIINQQIQETKNVQKNKKNLDTSPNTSNTDTKNEIQYNNEQINQQTVVFTGKRPAGQPEKQTDISEIWQSSLTQTQQTQRKDNAHNNSRRIEFGPKESNGGTPADMEIMEQSYAGVPMPEPRVQAASAPEHSVTDLSAHHLNEDVAHPLSQQNSVHFQQEEQDHLDPHPGIYTESTIFSVDPRALDKRIQGIKESLFNAEPHDLMQAYVSPDPELLHNILSRKTKKQEQQNDISETKQSDTTQQQKKQQANKQATQNQKTNQRRHTSPEVQNRQGARVTFKESPENQRIPTKPIIQIQTQSNKLQNRQNIKQQQNEQILQENAKLSQQKGVSKVVRTIGTKPVIQDTQEKAILQLYQLQQQQFLKLIIMVSRQKKLQAAQKIFFKVFCLIQDQLLKQNEQSTQIHTYNTLYPLVQEYNDLGRKYAETMRQLPNDYIIDKIQHYCDLNNYMGNKKIDYIKIGSEKEAKKFATDCNELLKNFQITKQATNHDGSADLTVGAMNMLSSQNQELYDIQEKILKIQQLQYELASLKNE